MGRSYRKIRTGQEYLDRVQDYIDQAFGWLLGQPTLQGNLIEGVVITAGTPASVAHLLNRNYRVWWIAKIDASATVWETANAIPDRYLVLNASATATVSVWVA